MLHCQRSRGDYWRSHSGRSASHVALAKSSSEGDKTFKFGNDEFFTLEEDQYITMAFDVKLDQSAGNEYQGAKYSGNLMVQAKQTDQGAKFEKKK